jgi:hypothetical protein
MELFKKLSRLFTSQQGGQEDMSLWLYVRCSRCEEKIKVRIDLRNDLSIEYGNGGPVTYFTRKTIVGEQRCYQPIEIELTFDQNRRLVNQDIKGGEFINKDEYDA